MGEKSKNAFIIDWDGEVLLSSISTESRGVAVLFNETLDYKIIKVDNDTNGNLIMIELEIKKILCLSVIYGPNREKTDFYSDIKISGFLQMVSP